MTSTVLITGCSSGFGRASAAYFLARGWNVIATMRTPRADLLPASERMRILRLDVTDPDSIAAAIEAAGPIDVLVNNAGIGLLGALEATPMHTTREVFNKARELGVEMPITCEVNAVLSEGRSPRTAVENLLNREQKAEHY